MVHGDVRVDAFASNRGAGGMDLLISGRLRPYKLASNLADKLMAVADARDAEIKAERARDEESSLAAEIEDARRERGGGVAEEAEQARLDAAAKAARQRAAKRAKQTGPAKRGGGGGGGFKKSGRRGRRTFAGFGVTPTV
ncbi:hypothetical protein Q9L58_009307 [Maublancomyces gigas]|uniref:Uncharacterized protein n=1 Tax=Discina gigas TaxID=1032678 RepID=A0ABR3G7A5_9PEZI